MKDTTDIVVIGAGVIGLACAWKLARQGLRVTLLERGDGSKGASWASLGVLAAPSSLRRGPFQELHRASLLRFESFVAELESDSGVPVEFLRCGSLEVISTEAKYIQSARELEGCKEDDFFRLELWSSEETRQRAPQLEPTLFGVLYKPMTARLRVSALRQALTAACRNAGVQIRTGCPVTRIDMRNERVAEICTPSATIDCSAALVCAGAWSSELHPLLNKYCRVAPVRGQSLWLKKPDLEFNEIIRWDKLYLVPQGAGEILVGSTTETASGFVDKTTAAGVEQLLSSARQAIPALGSAVLERVQAGLRPASADRKPLIGPVPEVKGLFAATGHYKIGLGMAPLTAEAIVALLTSGKLEFDFSPFYPRTAEEPDGT